MLAGIATERGLQMAEVPEPMPGRGQVLIKVHAAGVNWGDLRIAKGAHGPESLGHPIGAEWSGVVMAVGQDVNRVVPGDRVAASGRGGYAEYAVADEYRIIRLAADDPLEEAATLPIVLMTAHDALVTNGELRAGEAVLVHGASSAVGIVCCQLAGALGAAVVLGTSRSQLHREALQQLGADLMIDPSRSDWAGDILNATGGRGADLLVDMVSGAGFGQTMRAARVQGRIINVGRLGGAHAEIDLEEFARKRLRLTGVTFRTRSPDEVSAILSGMLQDVWPLVRRGAVRLPIHSRFPLRDAPAAHALMQTEPYFGKLLIVP